MVQGQKYHFLYKTTCKETGRFYIGVHSTLNLNDSYLGSGIFLRNSIQKYGIENHSREILEQFNDRESLMNREREVVDEEMLKDPLCMNLKRGGKGGLTLVNKEIKFHIQSAGGKSQMKKLWSNESFRLSHANRNSEKQQTWKCDWRGRFHTEKTKIKMTESRRKGEFQKGEKNSQFGTIWITNEKDSKKINIEEIIPIGWRRGRKRINNA